MEKLPQNVMIEEILLKLPASSLVYLRYVSKDFWSLITSPSFIKLHLLRRHSSIAQLNNNNNHNNNNNPSPNSLLISSRHGVLIRLDDGGYSIQLKPYNYDCIFPIINTTSTSNTTSPEIVEMRLPFEFTEIRGSCNGLLYLHQRRSIFDAISYYIWNPCTREYKQLPPPPPPLLLDRPDVGSLKDLRSLSNCSFAYHHSTSGFCGFGYDRNNDEYKILHYENRVHPNFIVHADRLHELQSISSIIEFNLYTLGTNEWTPIADNPYRSFYFKEPSSKRIGLLVNGALHWIMALSDPRSKGKIISFDIEKEMFREVQKPRYYEDDDDDDEAEEVEHFYVESLQILQECLCMCQINTFHRGGGGGDHDNKIDIWMLQDYDVMDSWTKLFRVVIPDMEFTQYQFRLLRYYENGEILILRNHQDVIVYDPVNHKSRCAKKFNESTTGCWKYYMDYTESLVCLNSGTYRHYRASS